MKKHLAKIFGIMFATCLLLTGCATVSNVLNEKNEIIYYGGSAVSVGGYTYFANAYTPYDNKDSYDYGLNSNISYLARVKTDLSASNGKNFSPDVVEKVNSKVVGFQNQDMFVLGNYIYFTSLNTHMYDNGKNDFSLVTLYRSALNGDNLQELYTTEYYTNGKFAPAGDLQNGYYWICFTGDYTEESKFSGQIFSIKLGDQLGGVKLLAEKASSAAFANVNEDGDFDRVLYTTTDKDQNTNREQKNIYSINYAGENKVKYDANDEEITLIDKVQDVVFFKTDKEANISFKRDVAAIQENDIFNTKVKFAYATEFTDVKLICKDSSEFAGYIYKGTNLVYVKKGDSNGNGEKLEIASENFLFIDGEYIYYTDGSAIYKMSIKPAVLGGERVANKLVTMNKTIQKDQFGFDGTYVYYFAGLEDEEIEEEVEDNNLYMYRVKKAEQNGKYQLIGKTVNTRTPKQEN